ncbi:MAG TPA: multicopper oxidase domain-containing protein [Candidatus Binatia bacterium]|nr:multicopper oxidase domain-containing protein [Candidatus Binatia bacterium]
MTARRSRLYIGLVGAVALLCAAIVSSALASKLITQTLLDAKTVPQFVDDLPDFSALGRVDGDHPYQVRFEEFQQKILPDSFYATLPAPFSAGTMVFGYGVDQADSHYPPLPAKGLYPGYTVVVTRGHKAVADYRNHLNAAPEAPAPFTNPQGPSLQNFLTGDVSIHWANPLSAPMTVGEHVNADPFRGPQPAVTHLHGAEDPSAFDGGPDQWWTPGAEGSLADPPQEGHRGSGFVSNVYQYPNTQEPTTLWFHDHTLGGTRLNVFASLAAFYFIRGNGDDGMPGKGKLPAGRQEVELVIQDRQFDTNGQLLFPDGYPSGLDGPLQDANIHPYWMPEFFGDVIVVNGKSWPKLDVDARRYRFRLLNGANTRFFNLQFCAEVFDLVRPPQSACADKEINVPFYVIGNDGGLLDTPVRVDRLLFSPGERYDIIVDFSRFKGKKITVRNDAVTPYPSAFAKFTPGLQDTVMQFVVRDAGVADDSYNPDGGGPLRGPGSTVAPSLEKIVRLPGTEGGLPLGSPIADGTKVQVYRQLTLNPTFGSGGCHFPPKFDGDPILELLLNNSNYSGLRHGATAPVSDAVKVAGNWETEFPQLGSTEIWDLIDLSNDDHPIHIHLVQFQVIKRIPFDLVAYGAAYDAAFPDGHCVIGHGPPKAYNTPNSAGALGGNPDVTKFFRTPEPQSDGLDGPARPEEAGWKDTVIAATGHVTRVAVRFTPQHLRASAKGTAVNYSGRNEFDFDPTDADPSHTGKGGYPGGPGYVWHCHIIDHEDNEMMRPWMPSKSPGNRYH